MNDAYVQKIFHNCLKEKKHGVLGFGNKIRAMSCFNAIQNLVCVNCVAIEIFN